ncbi:MAG: TonB-dependent receptor [Bacteroidia bacterium]|nr:TonB-dependent receptor [Bacteroidia bacterium]
MKQLLFYLCTLVFCVQISAQQANLTKERIMSMSLEELSDLPLEDLMQAAETLGVSSVDELFAAIMNKSVSSASKKEEDSFVSPLPSSTLTKEEIRMYGVTSIEEALKLIPGIIVTQKTNGVYDVQVRGLGNIPDNNILLYAQASNVLLMLDGRAAFNYTTGAFNIDQLPISIEDVERIEVIRGATSALYGAGAVQGVINIITEKPNSNSNLISGSGQMGSQNTNIADLALRGAINDKVAVGAVVHLQQRNRDTNKLYVYNNNNVLGLPNENNEYVEPIAPGSPQKQLINPVKPGFYSLSDLAQMKQFNDLFQRVEETSNPERKNELLDRFPDPFLARRSMGGNGYLSITPHPETHIDLTFGYGQERKADVSLIDNFYSLSYQELKSGYANLAANIKNFQFRGSYYQSSNAFQFGTPELKMKERQVQVSTGYDLALGQYVGIRPGIDFNWSQFKDYDSEIVRKYGGFLNSCAIMKSITPSIKAELNIDKFRTVVAVRSDRTNMPDKWNTSTLAALSFKPNNDHFFRFSFSHGMRAATLINSSTSYSWTRPSTPNKVAFKGNPDAELMTSNNWEFGYRTRPASNIIVDFEAYLSNSKNFGELMSMQSQVDINSNILKGMGALGGQNIGSFDEMPIMAILQQLDISSYVRYHEVPFEVNQIGMSANVDWSLSRKLMAKLNVNVQKTTIDNYYKYSQSANIMEQLFNIVSSDNPNGIDVPQSGGMRVDKECAMGRFLTFSKVVAEEIGKLQAQPGGNLSSEQIMVAIAQVIADMGSSSDKEGLFQQIPSEDGKSFTLRLMSDKFTTPKLENNHKHKATPSFYGTLGLYYRPLPVINVATTLSFMSEREYATQYGVDKLDSKFTMDLKIGFRPDNRIEVYVNARNLFNNQSREFAYTDNIGGFYTGGVTFNF